MFLYFVPGRVAAVPDLLKYAFDSKTYSHAETMSGPLGSGAGMVLADLSVPVEKVRLKPDAQKWVKIPKTELYVGIYTDDIPNITPDKLQRPTMQEGHPVELENGSRWQCAIARGFDADTVRYYSNLPRSLELDPETGRWVTGQFAPQYRRFVHLALAYAAEYEGSAVENSSLQFDFPEVDELAILGLTCNYRISQAELALIGDVYSVRVRDDLLDAILDYPTIKAWQKKRTDAGLDTSGMSPGQTQLTTDNQASTSPASPN